MYQENSEEELKSMQTYGFGNLRSGVFARLQVSLFFLISSASFYFQGDFFFWLDVSNFVCC